MGGFRLRTAPILIVMVLLSGCFIGYSNGTSDPVSREQISNLTGFIQPNVADIDINEQTEGVFIENKGQWDEEILFITDTSFGHLGLGKGSVYFDLSEYELKNIDGELESVKTGGHVVKYTFIGSNEVIPIGIDPLPHYSNYFLHNDESRWASYVKSYQMIIYKDLWDNIDLKYYPSNSGYKYDLILNPYADVSDIKIKVEGVQGLDINNNRIEFRIDQGKSILDKDLLSFYGQDTDRTISSNFVLYEDNSYGFELEKYDKSKRVTIDPLIFSTLIGGPQEETLKGTQIDEDDNLIICGTTESSTFPTISGAYQQSWKSPKDLYVLKLKSDGSDLIFSTFIGGNPISATPRIDHEGNIFISGQTQDPNFITTTGAFDRGHNGNNDIFALKLKNDGSSLTYSTFIGGTDTEWCHCRISDSGTMVMVGYTKSANFPTTSGVYDDTHNGNADICVFELRSDGSDLVFSTFIGGCITDRMCHHGLDISGNIIITGCTDSPDFPTTEDAYDRTHNGQLDGFLLKLKNDGSDMIFSTLFGGSEHEIPRQMFFDEDGSIAVIGSTLSNDLPTNEDAFDRTLSGTSDYFVIKIKDDGSESLFCTYIGTSGSDSGATGAMDVNGNIIICLNTNGTDFPTTSGAYCQTNSGKQDICVCMLTNDGSDLSFSTYIGGSETEASSYPYLVPDGIIIRGTTRSEDFPTTEDALSDILKGPSDDILFKLDRTGSTLLYSTFIGGSQSENVNYRALIGDGQLYFSGITDSNDFPTTSGSYNTMLQGKNDTVVMKFDLGSGTEPLNVTSVKLFSDPSFSMLTSKTDLRERVYIELEGEDGNASFQDFAKINISFSESRTHVLRFYLLETGLNTGIYRNNYRIPIGATLFETLNFSSIKDPTKTAELIVEYPFRPISITSVEVFKDDIFSIHCEKADHLNTVYIKATGTDSNLILKDKAYVNISGDKNLTFHHLISLEETEADTGEYVGLFIISPRMQYFENITITSVKDESKTATFMVHTPIQLRPFEDNTTAYEDVEYREKYWNFGYETATWTTEFYDTWLKWDSDTSELYGTPNNNHIGPWDVQIEISDDDGHIDSHDFLIMVKNTPPNILSENVLFATEGKEYRVDYNSSDDGQGEVIWTMFPDDKWLSINKYTGELIGTPIDDDKGFLNVTVSVHDGNGGSDSTSFQLEVIDVNQAPNITNMDITTWQQGERYYRDYDVHDGDRDDTHHWELTTNATFLSLNEDTGVLEGTPGLMDVGVWYVNVTVIDSGGLLDSHTFDLTIEDENDKPIWEDTPGDFEILHGTLYTFDVNATDPNIGNIIEYTVNTNPDSDLTIDSNTGMIEWIASVQWFEKEPYRMTVSIKASDGEVFNIHAFIITIIPTESPEVEIITPGNEERTSSAKTYLSWIGTDPEDEPITYDIYLHQTDAFVQGYREEALYKEGFNGTNITLSELDPGKRYFWMVIPNDGCSFGTCTSGVLSFRVNYKPTFNTVKDQEVPAGTDFKYKISCTDEDSEDIPNLKYSLAEAPDGMTISEETGMIRWTPKDNQVMLHTVTVQVTDGIEFNTATFEIEVTEGESSTSTLIITIAIVVVVILLIAVGIFFFMKKKKQMDEEALKRGEEERAELEKEREDEYASYEDLYGVPAPEKDEEGLTATELKDYIHDQIDELNGEE